MGIPFDEINEILLKTNLDAISYYNLKNLLIFFITGKNTGGKLSKAIEEFKKKALVPSNSVIYPATQIQRVGGAETPSIFIIQNTKAFDNIIIYIEKGYPESLKEKFNIILEITDKFNIILEITDKLIAENSKSEYVYKKIIKKTVGLSKNVKDVDNYLLKAFQLDHRRVRNENKQTINSIDTFIEEHKETLSGRNDYNVIVQKIKKIIDVYGKITDEQLRMLFVELGLGTRQKGGCEDILLVGYLCDDIEYNNDGTVKSIGVEIKNETQEKKHNAVLQNIDKALEFFTIVYYITVNNSNITRIFKSCKDIIIAISKNSTLFDVPVITQTTDVSHNLLLACYNGLIYFINTIDEELPLQRMEDVGKLSPLPDDMKAFVITKDFNYKISEKTREITKKLSTDIQYIIELDFMSKNANSFDAVRTTKIFSEIKNSSYIQSTNPYHTDFIDLLRTFDFLKKKKLFTLETLKLLLVRTIIVLYSNNEKTLQDGILNNMRKYENEIYFDSSKKEEYYTALLYYMIYLKTELPPINSYLTKKNAITIDDHIYLHKHDEVKKSINDSDILISPILIVDDNNISAYLENTDNTEIKNVLTNLSNNDTGYSCTSDHMINITYCTKLRELLTQFKHQKQACVYNYTKMKEYLYDSDHKNYNKYLSFYKNSVYRVRDINLVINAKMLFIIYSHLNYTIPLFNKEVSKHVFLFQLITDVYKNTCNFDKENTLFIENYKIENPVNRTDNELYISMSYFYNYYSDKILNTPIYVSNHENLTIEITKRLSNIKKFYTIPIIEDMRVGGNKKLITNNLNNVILQDRIHFILLIFIIRAITLFIIDVAIENGYIKKLSQSVMLYFTIYLAVFLLVVILTNANVSGFKDLFYYLNTTTEDGRGLLRILLQLTCICSLLPIPYIVKDKKELDDITLYILILTFIVTLIV